MKCGRGTGTHSNGLKSFAFRAWAGDAAVRAWLDGMPVRFRVTVEALVDKRKVETAEKQLAQEAEEDAS